MSEEANDNRINLGSYGVDRCSYFKGKIWVWEVKKDQNVYTSSPTYSTEYQIWTLQTKETFQKERVSVNWDDQLLKKDVHSQQNPSLHEKLLQLH